MYRFVSIICCFICLLLGSSGYGQQTLDSMEFLLGTWKIENKDTYESWEDSGAAVFEGKTFKLSTEGIKVLETLTLMVNKGAIVYLATVPDQNEGQTIPFTLNAKNTDYYSFENPDHDFPKKIQYGIISSDTLSVRVLGEREEGFSYRLIRHTTAGN